MSVKKSSGAVDEAQRGLRMRQSQLQKLGVENDIEYAAGALVLIEVKCFRIHKILATKTLSPALVSGYHGLQYTGGRV
jgi:hypothetical protein